MLVKRHDNGERDGDCSQDCQGNQAVDQLYIHALHGFFGIVAHPAFGFVLVIHTSMTPPDPSVRRELPVRCQIPRRPAWRPPMLSPPTRSRSAVNNLRKAEWREVPRARLNIPPVRRRER